jgi:hypothetical protein
MTNTTIKSMNILLEKNENRINAKVPARMKELIEVYAEKLNMSSSQYIKLALNERLEKDIKS